MEYALFTFMVLSFGFTTKLLYEIKQDLKHIYKCENKILQKLRCICKDDDEEKDDND